MDVVSGIWVYPVLGVAFYYVLLLSLLMFNRATVQFGIRLRVKKLLDLTIEMTYDVVPQMLMKIKKDNKLPEFSHNIASDKIWKDILTDKELVHYYTQVDKSRGMPLPSKELLEELSND